MHTLLFVSSILLVVLGGSIVLALLPSVTDWERRRRLLLLVLASPAVSLGAGLAGLYHFDHRICFLGAPVWDRLLGTAIPDAMALVGLGAAGLSVLRLGLLWWAVLRRSAPAAPDVLAVTDRLARRLGVAGSRVRICASHQPLALTCGLRRPTFVLSTWMLRSLDAREFESVVAHELGHAARRDYAVAWLATVLRDAFFYLPTTRRAYRQLMADKEIACDDLAASVTGRPLALASALAKVWHHVVGDSDLQIAPSFADLEPQIEERIERLLRDPSCPCTVPATTPLRMRSPRAGAFVLASLLVLQAAGVVAMLLTPTLCSPASPPWRLV